MDRSHPNEVDICLLLEGSYPFVLGGVSAWTHKIIQAFPEYTFSVIFLGGHPEDYAKGRVYELPVNVTHFEMYYLFHHPHSPPPRPSSIPPACLQEIKGLHALFRNKPKQYADLFQHLDFYLGQNQKTAKEQFFYSKDSWDYITEQYLSYSTEPSFIDYFWTIRNIHGPLWVLPSIIKDLPKAKLIHTISTGYAGFLGALLHNHFGYPLVLSEHGIYTKERRIEILSSNIFREINFMQEDIVNISYLRTLWNNFFESLAKSCYSVADPVISLFQGANCIQIEYGVDPKKAEIIPNGIDVDYYTKMYTPFDDKPRPIVGFIGRIVPIKDVKTLIRAIAIVKHTIKDVEAWLVGPTDEDPEYLLECQGLIQGLELEQYVKFKAMQTLGPIYSALSVVVLSSISEGMPLVVLESNAAGVPVIATDVGACRELIEGREGEDAALGKSGQIVKIADPEGLAKAIIAFLARPDLWNKASQAGMARVKRYYDQNTMFEKYKNIYQKRLA